MKFTDIYFNNKFHFLKRTHITVNVDICLPFPFARPDLTHRRALTARSIHRQWVCLNSIQSTVNGNETLWVAWLSYCIQRKTKQQHFLIYSLITSEMIAFQEIRSKLNFVNLIEIKIFLYLPFWADEIYEYKALAPPSCFSLRSIFEQCS